MFDQQTKMCANGVVISRFYGDKRPIVSSLKRLERDFVIVACGELTVQPCLKQK